MLLKLTEDLKKCLDQNMIAGLLAMDLSKAFDVIPHGLFIAKAHAYGCSHRACQLLLSYLKNRKQRVKMGEAYSKWVTPCKGVPQGSILGPLIFNIFMNDFFYLDLNSQVYNYADDNTLCLIGQDLNLIKSNLESDASKSVRWFSSNQMQANPDKFQAMLISRKNVEFSLNLCGSDIKAQDDVEILGVTLDNKLKYDKMVSQICRKASAQINVLWRLKSKFDHESRQIIYNSFIMSNMTYCQTVWTYCSITCSRKLEKLNERALRFVNNDFSADYDDQMKKANKTTLQTVRLKAVCVEMYKVYNRISPSYINEMFSLEFCNYSLRAMNTFFLPKYKTKTHGYKSFMYMGVKLWNALTNDMRCSQDLNEFKVMLNDWFVDKDITMFI